MKCTVPLDPILVIPDLRRTPHAGLDVHQIGFTGLHRRDRGHRGLDDKPRLENGCRTSADDALVYADRADRSAAEKGAVTTSSPDMSIQFHPGQKMPQRTSADTEFGCKLALGRELVTVGQRFCAMKASNSLVSPDSTCCSDLVT